MTRRASNEVYCKGCVYFYHNWTDECRFEVGCDYYGRKYTKNFCFVKNENKDCKDFKRKPWWRIL